jgi:hypothetical protein
VENAFNLPFVGKVFMFLGYMDDSGRFDKKKQTYQIVSTVLVRDNLSESIEHLVGQVVEDVIPEDRLERFEEFHAWELYGGYGIFDGIDQEKRFDAIKRLLSIIRDYEIPVVYGAVDLQQLQQRSYASANPIDIAFRLCIEGTSWVMSEEQRGQHGSDSVFALLIVDDTDKDKKAILKKSFRELRRQIRPPDWHPRTWYIHDDMYFGSSKDSIGIQLADLCSYFIGKHLEKDELAEGFYQIFSDLILYSEVEPHDEQNERIRELRPSARKIARGTA